MLDEMLDWFAPAFKMKQNIITIFSVNQLIDSKQICLSSKTYMENIQDSFSKFFILSRG